MTSANLTQTLLKRVQTLPQLKQQEILASIEDEDLLTNLSPEELQALAGVALSTDKQMELRDLLARNQENQLSVEEVEMLDRLLEQIDQLNLLKARAQYTLKYLSQSDIT